MPKLKKRLRVVLLTALMSLFSMSLVEISAVASQSDDPPDLEDEIEGPICGDGVCDSEEENCKLCPSDCGCPSGYDCRVQVCEAIRCGDGYCSAVESCLLDNCCGGNTVDKNSDENNCGGCGNFCERDEVCRREVCTLQSTCGDGICSDDEDCERDDCCDGDQTHLRNDELNCGRCGRVCALDERCERGRCTSQGRCGDGICGISENYFLCMVDCGRATVSSARRENRLDRCTTSDDCDDKNDCTIDRCEGRPRICRNEKVEGCGVREKQNTTIEETVTEGSKEQPELIIMRLEEKNVFVKFRVWLRGMFR